MSLRIHTLAGLLLLAVLVCRTAMAAPPLERLAGDPAWRRLIHYEPDRSSSSGWRSAIHSESFFLAGLAGAWDPGAELAATIAAMAQPVGADPDAHAQCRFPARRRWLAGFVPLPEQRCPKFERWSRAAGVESVSIVFASGYLGNPASYYGHTLLKLNFADDGGHTRLEDSSVNYGAILTGDDDPLTYIFKGVFGGYDGGFSDIQFYFHDHNYGENELRDLWEYRLALPPDALKLIVAHAWEVLGQRYDYYFLRRNCAYRMAEIVEVVDGLDIIPPELPWTIPQALLQRLANASYRGRPLVAEIIRHPSRQTRFYEDYLSLSADEAGLLEEVVQGKEQVDGIRLRALTQGAQHAVLDGLIDYYQFVADPQERAAGRVTAGYAEALATRYRLTPGSRPAAAQSPAAPHAGRPPSWLQLGWVHGSEFGNALSLRIRPAYYDPLDAGSGHVPNATLAMGDLQLRTRAGSLRLQRFDLVAIESANPAVSGLPGDRGEAWKLRFGVESDRPGCSNCLVTRLQGDIGLGRRLGDDLFAAVYAGGAVHENRGGRGIAFARASADVIARPHARLAMRMGYEHRIPVDAPAPSHGIGYAELRLAVGARGDLRLRHDWGDATLTTAGIGVYW